MSKKLKKTDPKKIKVTVKNPPSATSGKTITPAGGKSDPQQTNIKKDYTYGGLSPRIGGLATKSTTSNLKGPTKKQVKVAKKFAVKPTVNKAMRKHSKKMR